MRRFNHILLIFLLVISVLTLSSCKKKDKGINVKVMHTITFMVDNTQYGKSYIVEGEQGKPINGPIIEGRKFLYWGIDEKEFNFATAIYENIELTAYFEEAATFVITDKIDFNNLQSSSCSMHNDIVKASVVKGSLIKAGIDGSCYFYLSNNTTTPIKFTISFIENNIVGIPLQYNFRTIINNDSSRIWKDIEELNGLEITLPATSRILFSLDWVWQHEDSEITELYINESSQYVDVVISFKNFQRAE